VAPGNRDLERAPRDTLPDDVSQIRRVGGHDRREDRWLGNGKAAHPRQVCDGVAQARGGMHRDAAHRGRLVDVGVRHDRRGEPAVTRRGHQRHRARHRAEATVERHLTDQRHLGEPRRVELTRGGEDADRHREVVAGALLREVGRGQVDRDATRRQLEAAVAQGAAHALARLEHRAAGQSHDREPGEPERDVHLHAHRLAAHADDRGAHRLRQHGHTAREALVISPEGVPAACLLASLTPAATGPGRLAEGSLPAG
jgi:hypothetical protein